MAVRIAMVVVCASLAATQAAAGTGVQDKTREVALMTAIAAWLAADYNLPFTSALPEIAFTSPDRMAALVSGGVSAAQDKAPSDHPDSATWPEIVAAYDSLSGTIHLPKGWSHDTPANSSMLVHEMVHHLQRVGGLRYACPEEREKLAFAAQERWLKMFNTNLERAFGIDSLTLFVRTNCLF